MANLYGLFNEQIRRVAVRQINRQGKVMRRLIAQHRRDIAALKRQMSGVLRAVSYLERSERRHGAPLTIPGRAAPAGSAGLRFRADGLKTHRAKLGLSAADYGKLVGVSGLTIYHWESRKAKPRRAQMHKIAAVRGLGKREAVKRLDLLK